MPMYDPTLTQHATGAAIKTVEAHQDPQEITYHASWYCPFTHRGWITLEEKNIPYQYREINIYKHDENYDHFLEINPKGLVPALEYHGKALGESLILTEFLEDAYPEAQPALWPADAFERAYARLWVDYVAKSIVPAYFRLIQAQGEERQAAAREEYYKILRTFADLVKGPYFLGEQFSFVDVAIAPFVVRDTVLKVKRGYERAEVGEKWKAYAETVEKRPSVVKTTSNIEDIIQFYGPYLRDEADSQIAKATRQGNAI
ncbi:glutathione S-transferase family protein [Phanerochaete sordida]|uniref:Glutathione S-transferase family protein n=1 Tax=Phanerochaete sordida TaxID=48140 RepID=A0A9P3GAR4_9APHY|nr:glutathione S-transferase family protein [Phanerochaete sordida]